MKYIEVDLKTLPKEHHLRNTPLIHIGAKYLPQDSTLWQPIRTSYGIALKTYNNLGEVWTLWDKWVATIDPYDCDEPHKTEW